MKFTALIDDDLWPLLLAEKARMERAAGLRSVSTSAALNVALRRALTAGKAKSA